MTPEQKVSAYERQIIDCNCNDCAYLVRANEVKEQVLADNKLTQELIFNASKSRKISKAKNDIENITKHRRLISNADAKIEGKQKYLKEVEGKEFRFAGDRTQILYGICSKLEKQISFIPNTLQIETQICFKHRKQSNS
jgi:hypothetical protein